MPKAHIIIHDPVISVLGTTQLDNEGVMTMARWVEKYRPECVPKDGFNGVYDLLPHSGYDDGPDGPLTRVVSDGELLAEVAGRKCFDARTEVLTKDGWISFPLLKEGEEVATLNAVGTIEFQRPTSYLSRWHKGRMYVVESRAFSIRVTDDHDMWVRFGRGGAWRFAQASEVAGRSYGILRAAPMGSSSVVGGVSNAWASFLGYYMAEGSLVDGRKYGCGSRVIIYQKRAASAPILKALRALKMKVYTKIDPRNDVLHITLNDSRLARKLAEHGVHSYEKRLPREVFSWPSEARAVLLDAMMYGDGTVCENGARVYTTTSKQLADDVQLLILLSGRPGTISKTAPGDGSGSSFKGNHVVYRVREGVQVVSEINTHGARHDRFEDVDEEVYCVSVPNRILVLRRDDKVFMASNCYDSFGEKGAKRTNGEYLESMWKGRVPHRSTGYHPHLTFFFGEVSRRLSHEMIRNYVGHAKDEEGEPSQESTRFTHHPGIYIMHPADIGDPFEDLAFRVKAQRNYDEYCDKVERKIERWKALWGSEPKGLDRKRIYESAAGDLLMSCGTSFVWTTNPMALVKFFQERDDVAADLEMCRFARALKRVCFERWPNFFRPFFPDLKVEPFAV